VIWERDLKKWCSHLWFERGETGISYKSFSQISLSNHSLQGVSREWFEREIWKNELVIFPNLSLKSLSPIPHSSHSLEFLHLISLSLIIVSLVTPSSHFLKSLSQINVSVTFSRHSLELHSLESLHLKSSSLLIVTLQSLSLVIFSNRYPPAPMNHIKYLRAGPAEMPFQNWYTANTNHFHLTDSVRWKSKNQLGWVINPVPHNLVRRIRFWRIKSSGTWFYIFVLDKK